ncbi:MAG: hypothetical protein DMG67_01545 [Acidobacteria bacterium]|nr:MAG: hypothetical protein DMG67_01545 [Acidobacteriota bacterium]
MALLLRPLSIGEMLDRTFSIYRDHFKLFVGIFVFPQLAILAVNFGLHVILHAAASSPAAAPIAALGFVVYLPVYFATIMVTYAVGQAATVYAVSQVYLDRPTTISQAYSFIKGRFWSILGVVLLVFIGGIAGTFVGLLALLVGAIVLPVLIVLYSALAVPVTVLEGRDPVESIKRSYNLVKDDLGRIFLIWVLFFAIQIAASGLITIPAILLAEALSRHGQVPLWLNALSDLGEFVVGCVVRPLLTIAFSIAYYDERVRKEALDMQFMMAAIDRNAMSSAAAMAGGPAVPPSA